jgi:hypothetical protein
MKCQFDRRHNLTDCPDPIGHIRHMHAVKPRGPWGIIAQDSITILLDEIERLDQPCPRCLSHVRDDAYRESMQRGEWHCDNCDIEGWDLIGKRHHEVGTGHSTRLGIWRED